jgi:hypothetical protein
MSRKFGVNCQVIGGAESDEQAYETVMRRPVLHCIFYLGVGKIIDPDLTRMCWRSDRLLMRLRLSSLRLAREPHVRKRRCFNAVGTIRLGRCRRPDPKISAEPSAKERGLT